MAKKIEYMDDVNEMVDAAMLELEREYGEDLPEDLYVKLNDEIETIISKYFQAYDYQNHM